MAWDVGTDVTVNGAGEVETGSGAKLALYTVKKSEIDAPVFYDRDEKPSDWEKLEEWQTFADETNALLLSGWVKNLRRKAVECNNTISGLIPFALANVVASVTISPIDGGLQRLPETVEALEPTVGPIADKILVGRIS